MHIAATAIPFLSDLVHYSAATDIPLDMITTAFAASCVVVDVGAQHASDSTTWRGNAGTISDVSVRVGAVQASYWSAIHASSGVSWGVP